VNHQAKYLGQRSIRSKVIFRSDKLINKYANGRLLYLSHKLTGKKLSGSLKLIETSTITVSIDVGLRKVLYRRINVLYTNYLVRFMHNHRIFVWTRNYY